MSSSDDFGKTWTEPEAGASLVADGDVSLKQLRDGLSADGLKPTGIYFGTRSGKLFGSTGGRESWNAIFESLPLVIGVKAAVAT